MQFVTLSVMETVVWNLEIKTLGRVCLKYEFGKPTLQKMSPELGQGSPTQAVGGAGRSLGAGSTHKARQAGKGTPADATANGT